MVDEAVTKGGKIILGGGKDTQGKLFYKPTILTELNKDMECFSEEIFGPVIPILKFENEEV